MSIERVQSYLPPSYLQSHLQYGPLTVLDNGPRFIGSDFENYLKKRGIKHKKSSVAYPQKNGQVEVTYRTLLRGIEKRLKERKNKWHEELPNVLWAYRTSPMARTRETPFKLAYDTEAMLPIEVGSSSYRAITFEEEGIQTTLELIYEVRDHAVQRMEKYKEKTQTHSGKKPNEDRVNTKKQNIRGYLEVRQRGYWKKFMSMFRPQ